ncbi:IPT/TIG domain-containing protein [Filimonas lacunae]|uniref:IPT/TIG domain-containing protein n=1 Tax=Filimonas lacunae TaxID=477680 RepID=A0A173MPS0_9BACT|nr:IPT/TIG domain-containing protein [Filimonas lacunae]BAV09486.1 hypothetical protein FLA_5535 [Filimonas lacunae]SIS74032.1 IPT/TIG domain-containing protein [Filimonas lacunae]
MKSLITIRNIAGGALMACLVLGSCKKDKDYRLTSASANPAPGTIDPGEAPANAMITLTGSGLGDIRTIVFDSGQVNAELNPAFNTDNAVLFRVPLDAYPASQNIVFTNGLGKQFSVPFKVLGFAVISDVSNYNFVAGDVITLTGKNLADVTEVTLVEDATATVTIVSKTATTLTIKMPATTKTRSALYITNGAGTITTTQEFVNMAYVFVIFAEGYGDDVQNGSWGPAGISTTVAKSGTMSFQAGYNKGNWSADGFASWTKGIAYNADYKYLSFWVKGGSEDLTFYITGDKRAGGYGNADVSAPILVPAKVWTYFKISLTSLDLWNKGTPFNQLGWWVKGPDSQDETLYFDDVILVK